MLWALASSLWQGHSANDIRNTELANPDTHFKLRTYASRAEWEARKWQLRKQILSAAGLLPMPSRKALNPRIIDREDHAGYTIENLLIETFPGYYLGATLYRPTGSSRYPAVLLPHGHWKKGRLENRPSYSVPALGINLALQGYVALAYDMSGYNDTRQTPHNFGGWREQLWSFNPLGLQLWNSIRAVDYLTTRGDVDTKRIGITGASGGGTQTFLLTAVDQRVRFASPVDMVSAHMQGGDPCEEAPNLRLNGANNVEFAAMAAPRPMLLVSSTHDWTRNTPGEEFPAIRSIYELYGAKAIANAHIDAEHNYNRASRSAVYNFFQRFVQLDEGTRSRAADVVDKDIVEPEYFLELANYLPRVSAPGALTYDQIFDQWIANARSQTNETRDLDQLRERLRFSLGAEWPGRVENLTQSSNVLLTRPGMGDRIPGRWISGSGNPVVIVHPDGSGAALKHPEVKKLIEAGRTLLLIDAFQTGAARAPRDYGGKWFLSYNQTDDANRVQDVLTALSYARLCTGRKASLVALDGAGVWGVFAAAVAPVDIDVSASLNGFEGSDESFHKHFFVPGIQRAGGIDAAIRLLNHPHIRW